MKNFEFPSFLSKEAAKDKSKEESRIWKQVKSYSKIAALSVLLSFPAISQSFAGDKGETSVDRKDKIGQLKEKAAGHTKDIALIMKNKGQSGMIGKTPVKRWEAPDKQISTVGYNDDQSAPQWLIHETGTATMRFFDDKADGSVDRIIINKDEQNTQAKTAFNDLKTFDSADNLAKEAEITAGLKPENVKVFCIDYKDGQYTIKSIDFSSGETAELVGPEAEELISKVQGSYTNSIEQLDGRIL